MGRENMPASIEISEAVAQRLNDDLVAWLTTVRSDGTPQTSLVWFLWDGGEFLIYSEPGKAKLRNISGNPVVSLNLNSIGDGGVAVFTGNARLSPEDDDPSSNQRYIEKYRSLIEGELATAVEAFATAYRVAIRVKPISLRSS
jgi:PPOX class probable F420-dependent enzyme